MTPVADILADLRAAILRRACVEGAVVGALAMVGAVLLGALALWWVPDPRVRLVALGGALLALAVPPLLRLASAERRYRDDVTVAGHLESRVPELRTDLRTALEWSRRADPEDDLAAGLRESLTRRMADAARALRPRLDEHVPRRDLRRPLTGLAALTALVVVGAFASPQGFGAGLGQLAFGVPELDAAGNPVSDKPIVSTVDFEVHAPAYTRMPVRRSFGSTGDVRALSGSEVRFEATALVPTREAVLRVDVGGQVQRTQLELVSGVRIRGAFTVTQDATWGFELTTPEGEVLVDPVARRIEAVADAAPSVDLLEPGDHVEVTPDEVVDLRYVALDDFGLGAVSLVWYFAGSEDDRREEPLQGSVGATRFEEHVPFDLAPLRLQPRDEIVVFVEALDNDQVSGAKPGRSRAVTLRVASPDDRHAEILAMKEQLFEALLRQLGGMLAAGMHTVALDDEGTGIVMEPAPGTPATHAERIAAYKSVHGAWGPVIQLYEAVMAAMDEDPLSIDADRDMLRGAYERLYDAVLDDGRVLEQFTSQMMRNGVGTAGFGLAAQRIASTIETTERVVLVLEDLVATHRADDVQRAMEELSDVRERLRELLEEYRDARDPELREQIERELRRLEARMRELLDRLAQQIDDLPVEHLNADAIEPGELAENISDMQSAMDQIRQMLDSGDIDAALSYLEQLEADLNAMDQELQPLGDSSPETLSEFDREMGEMMDELNNIEALETELEADTQELLDQMLAERAEQMEAQTSDEVEQARRLVDDLLDRFEEVDVTSLSEETRQAMEQTVEGLEMLGERLDEQDVSGAEAAATRLLSQVSDTQWELRRDRSMLVRDPDGRRQAEQAGRTAERTEVGVRDVRRTMRELMDAAQPQPNAAQRQQMNELAERQSEIGERLEQMQQGAEQMSERFPMVGESLGPTLEETGRHMQGAGDDLRAGRPRPALQGEHSALQSMQQMRQQMRQLTQRQRQREQRQSGRRHEDDVELPTDGESSRADFRRRVIESMRDESIGTYEEEIQQYYERLLE